MFGFIVIHRLKLDIKSFLLKGRYMKIVKWVLYILICILLLLIACSIVLPYFINANQYKSQIQALVKKQTGRHLILEGDIHWRLFPSAKLEIGKGVITNPKSFDSKGNFATFEQATASIALFPILNGAIEVNEVEFKKLHITLRQNNQGQNNWHFIKPENQAEAMSKLSPDNLQQAKPLAVDELEKPLKFSINRLKFINAHIDFLGTYIHRYTKIDQLNIELDSSKFPINYKMDMNFSAQHIKSASSAGTGELDVINNEFQLRNMTQQLNINSYKYGNYNINISGDLRYIAGQEQLHSNLSIYVQNLMNVYLHNIYYDIKNANYHVDTLIDHAQEAALLSRFNINLPSSNLADPNVVWDIQNLEFQLDGSKQFAHFKNISGRVGRSKIEGEYFINAYQPYQSKYNLKVHHLHLSDYVNLNGAEIYFKTVKFDGSLANDKVLTGNLLVKSRAALLSGVDLNKTAIKFQKFLESVVQANHIGQNFQKVRQELNSLSSLERKIDKDNGQSTRLYDLYMDNVIKDNTIYTKQFNWHGKAFSFAGTGQVDWQSKFVNYALRVYVYNQSSPNLQNYQKVFVPLILSGTLGNMGFSINQNKVEAQLKPIIQQTLHNVVNEQAGNLIQKVFH